MTPIYRIYIFIISFMDSLNRLVQTGKFVCCHTRGKQFYGQHLIESVEPGVMMSETRGEEKKHLWKRMSGWKLPLFGEG